MLQKVNKNSDLLSTEEISTKEITISETKYMTTQCTVKFAGVTAGLGK